MKRIYIDICNPYRSDKNVKIHNYNIIKSFLIRRTTQRLTDPLLVSIKNSTRKLSSETVSSLEAVLLDIRKTNTIGQLNN